MTVKDRTWLVLLRDISHAPRVEVVALVGGGGAEVLAEVPASDPAVRRFRSRLKARKGVHAVLIADAASASGTGSVYGLFECHLPTIPPAGRRPRSTPGKRQGSARKQS